MALLAKGDLAVGRPLMHIYKPSLHVVRGEERHIPDPQRLEDVFPEVVVQCETRGAHDELAGPVDVGPVFPPRAGLVHQRREQDV